ncbi:hypothetical protein ADUPG1_007773 [Aduncisulcus paluster]|uniref:Protein kinase domain-containing protein n=1 Tax=Aduncisulcus paluster TaxID=2918883 RepID=A0ABQ5KPH1_9EUKA|nr:hypothetical protein ADUPG1_007773 [Aduncisulcus paluster]
MDPKSSSETDEEIPQPKSTLKGPYGSTILISGCPASWNGNDVTDVLSCAFKEGVLPSVAEDCSIPKYYPDVTSIGRGLFKLTFDGVKENQNPVEFANSFAGYIPIDFRYHADLDSIDSSKLVKIVVHLQDLKTREWIEWKEQEHDPKVQHYFRFTNIPLFISEKSEYGEIPASSGQNKGKFKYSSSKKIENDDDSSSSSDDTAVKKGWLPRTVSKSKESGVYSRKKRDKLQKQQDLSEIAEIQLVQPEFIHFGDGFCCPIPLDAPNIKSPDYLTIKARYIQKKTDHSYDQSSEAQKMMKGEPNDGSFSYISIPFSSSSPIKGAYMCLYSHKTHPSHLTFTFTSSKSEKKSKKYEFHESEGSHHWYFLPVDLPDVVLCEITGKGRGKSHFYFKIYSLVFIGRDETSEEIILRETQEKLWSDAPNVKPEVIKEEKTQDLQDILRVDQVVIGLSSDMIVAKNDSVCKESKDYDQREKAQQMLVGESEVYLSYLSIPIPSPSPIKGAYLCVGKNTSSPSLLFTFTDSDGKKTSIKYTFTRPKHKYEWLFLPIDLDNVVLCEIEGKGIWREENCRCFKIDSLVFLRHRILIGELDFIHEGNFPCIPIPRDDPTFLSPDFPAIKGNITEDSDEYDEIDCEYYDDSAQHMLKGEGRIFTDLSTEFSCISVPFKLSTSIKGAYVCLSKNSRNNFTSSLSFTCTTSIGTKISYIYKFDEFFDGVTQVAKGFWFHLSINLPDVVLCEIEEGERKMKQFSIISLAFHREDTPEEYIAREKRRIDLEEQWLKSAAVTPEFITEGNFDGVAKGFWFHLSINLPDVVLCEIEEGERKMKQFSIISLAFHREDTPEEYIAREKRRIDLEEQWLKSAAVTPEFITEGNFDGVDDSLIINPSFSLASGKNDVYCKDSNEYDQSSRAQKMLKGEDRGLFGGDIKSSYVSISHLSIPFLSPSPMKGAYIRVDKHLSSPSLLFTFTLLNGMKISKKYEFKIPEHSYEWYFLLVDLPNVILCEIQGKGTWKQKQSRNFRIESLVFITGDNIPPLPFDSTKAVKHDSFTITSSATITPQCIIGHGGFGEVLLVEVEGIPIPCVLKKMLRETDEKVVEDCRKEFKMQRKLFNNPKCFNRIPRPLYILDLLDADMKGVYGFLMEFCSGGSVKDFARSWCVDGKYMREDDVATDTTEEESDEGGDFQDDRYFSEYSFEESCFESSNSHSVSNNQVSIDPMTLNPVKVCALCVGMIECLDDAFRAKRSLVHRDVKPDNFLVRVDPDSKKCTIVLSDLGMVQILDSMISSTTSKCGTLVYNSYETLMDGTQTQKSDGYSLGMSILALFLYKQPFVSLPIFKEVYKKVHIGKASNIDILKVLIDVMENNMCPRLSRSPLFKTLLTIEDGKYKLVHEVLNEVFTGLTKIDEDERMSVHEARKKVQTIKHLLPQIGEGFECPSIEDIVKRQLAKHQGDTGSIEGGIKTEKEKDNPLSVTLPSEFQSREKESRDTPSYDRELPHGSQTSALSTTRSTLDDPRNPLIHDVKSDDDAIQDSEGDHQDLFI